MDMRVAVIGAGSWGTTVAHLLASRAATTIWARDEAVATDISERRQNSRYLDGFVLDEALVATTEMRAAVTHADVVVMGVPSHGFRATLGRLAPHIRPGIPIVSLTKGLEERTLLRMTQVIAEVLPGHPPAALTGPNLAREIMAQHPAATVIAMEDQVIAEVLQGLFAREQFRVYTNGDLIGAELGGALKNVMAIASGLADGLGVGDNARAAVITRGLAELTRLGVAMGGRPETFSGLAGMGDLVATSISAQSRNRHVGELLGRGIPLGVIVEQMDMVAEGVKAAPVAVELAQQHGVEMPIATEVAAVCGGRTSAADAYRRLLARTSRPEVYGFRPGDGFGPTEASR